MKKQLRFSKKGENILNKILINSQEYNIDDFIQMIITSHPIEVIKLIDESCEDWFITEKCFEYFASQIMLENISEFDDKTKQIIDKLNKWKNNEKTN